jgi:hypothetical protein
MPVICRDEARIGRERGERHELDEVAMTTDSEAEAR